MFRVVKVESGRAVLVNQWGAIASREQVMAMAQVCKEHMKEFKTEFDVEKANAVQDVLRQMHEQRNSKKQEPKQESGFVYLMRNARNGMTKIGWSKTPSLREKTLSSEEPEISMFAYWEGTVKNERDLHAVFRDYRVRGEWFDLSQPKIDGILSGLESYVMVPSDAAVTV